MYFSQFIFDFLQQNFPFFFVFSQSFVELEFAFGLAFSYYRRFGGAYIKVEFSGRLFIVTYSPSFSLSNDGYFKNIDGHFRIRNSTLLTHYPYK